MKSKINEIIKDIENKKNELLIEYEKIKEKYGFSFKKGKIVFNDKESKYNKTFKPGLFRYVIFVKFKHLVSMPFIYSVIIPTIILDIFLFIFQQTCFRLYGIPLVKRLDYIIFDRRFLDYLNIVQKFNCLYCSYVNGIFSYAVEIGGRTEKYWCPIKYAKKMKGQHNWQEHFADYGDAKGFKESIHDKEVFYKK